MDCEASKVVNFDFCDEPFPPHLELIILAVAKKSPENPYITFIVGPEEKEISILKSLLSRASSKCEHIFERLELKDKDEENEHHDAADVVANGDKLDMEVELGTVALPRVHPPSFEIFIRMLEGDVEHVDHTVSSIFMEKELPLSQAFHIVDIAMQFGAQDIQHYCIKWLLENVFKRHNFFRSSELYDLTRRNVYTMVAAGRLLISEMDVNNAAIRWAGKQCLKEGLEATLVNVQWTLGYHILKIMRKQSTCYI